LWTADAPAFFEAAKASPFGKLLQDPASSEALGFLTEQFNEFKEEAAEETGMSFDELASIASGGMSMMLFPVLNEEGDFEDYSVVFLLETDDKGASTVEQLFNQREEEFETSSKSMFRSSGVAVYTISGDEV